MFIEKTSSHVMARRGSNRDEANARYWPGSESSLEEHAFCNKGRAGACRQLLTLALSCITDTDKFDMHAASVLRASRS